jgi:Bacterial conjugation TrbI-like protein
MKRFATAFLLATLCAVSAAAQTPQPSENTGSEASLAGGTAINAELNSSIDSKKAKPGEQITAHITETVKSTDGRAILPKGTKLIGHVTKASARSNGQDEAMLAIQFDKAVLKDKQEVPLNNAVIQAVAAPAHQSAAYGSDLERATAPGSPSAPSNNPSMSGSRGARPEGTRSTQTYPSASANGGSANGSGESNSAGPLPANARGVYGFEGLRLSANANGEGTVLTSSAKNVHLDGGTRLLLMVQPQTASATPSGH